VQQYLYKVPHGYDSHAETGVKFPRTDPVTIEVEIDRTAARVTFRGWDKFWALSPGLYIEARRIVAATVMPRRQASKECSWLRLPGSFWPGRLHADDVAGLINAIRP
jgi:hypothetical protein